jgi:protein O-mannosyl-transferase
MKRRNRSKLAENTREGSPGKNIPAGGEFSAQASFGRAILLAAGLIVLAAMAVYSNSFQCPFVFDDTHDIVDNPSIKHLWPIRDVFVVQSNGRAALHGRPVVNLSLALNYAAGGLEPFYYHLTNLLVHVLAGLTLFGIVRRTLLLPSVGRRFAAAATPLALAVALIWTLHPLNTAAVTFVVQRYESMMGLFYLLTLYAAVRCGTSEHPRRWAVAAVTAALLGMGCKEVAVSIPITILLYDRAFLAGSFREALRRRRGMYVGLAAAWAAFAVLFAFSYSRGRWAGYGLPVSWIEYSRSQFGVILHYLRLSFWPRPLVLDYAWPVARTVGQILPGAVVIGGLAAATAYALVRWPKWGFVGAWFFLILAPTSSIMPLADLAFEHRMYLSLAAVATGVVVGGWVAGQWFVRRGSIPLPALQVMGGVLVTFASIAFGILTFQRNVDYRSDISIWEDTVAKAPGNARACNNLGNDLVQCGRVDEAIAEYRKALKIKPDYAEVQNDLGVALANRGQIDEAIAEYRKALELKPDYEEVHNNLGVSLANRGQIDEAVAEYRKALEIKPDYAEAHHNLGNALAGCGQSDEALAHYQKALELRPDYAEAHNNLGAVLVGCGRVDEAIAHYRSALAINPDYAKAHNGLGEALLSQERVDEAISHFRKAVDIQPNFVEAHYKLGTVLADHGRADEAIAEYQKALELKPDHAEAHYNLGNALASLGRFAEAAVHYQQAIAIKPDHAKAHGNLGNALASLGQFDEAIAHFSRVVELEPGNRNARRNRDVALAQRERSSNTLAQRRESLRSHPDDVALLNETAWTLATNPNASIRNGAEAVELAQRAVELSGGREPAILGTLAAAQAEAGQFAEAVRTAEKALDLATQQNQQQMVESIKVKVPLYRAGTPFRETQPAVADSDRP